jgi:DNA-directed RNA polymerase subunit RPC12/RpoP
MEFRFLCPSCGRKLKADEDAAGMKVDCPDCGMEFLVPQSEVSLPATQPEPPAEPTRDPAFANPNADGDLTCPVCWLRFDAGDIMHIAVHDSLRGEQSKQLNKDVADSAFSSYLDTAKSLDQYVVFEVKPSGIGLFQDLVKSARDKGFDVGYDALEEDKNPHLSPLPSVDESTPPTDTSATASAQQPSASNDNSGTPTSATPAASSPKPTHPQPAAATSSPAPQKNKSWWQRFLEWAGLS